MLVLDIRSARPGPVKGKDHDHARRRPRANRRRQRRRAGDAMRRVHNDQPPGGVETNGAAGDRDFGVVGARGLMRKKS